MKNWIRTILVIICAGACGVLLSALINTNKQSYHPLPASEIRKVNIWTPAEIDELQASGRIGDTTVPDGEVFAEHIRAEYLRSGRYYVEVGTKRNVQLIIWVSGLLALLILVLIVQLIALEKNVSNKRSEAPGVPPSPQP